MQRRKIAGFIRLAAKPRPHVVLLCVSCDKRASHKAGLRTLKVCVDTLGQADEHCSRCKKSVNPNAIKGTEALYAVRR